MEISLFVSCYCAWEQVTSEIVDSCGQRTKKGTNNEQLSSRSEHPD